MSETRTNPPLVRTRPAPFDPDLTPGRTVC
jgi:hypothetical protein